LTVGLKCPLTLLSGNSQILFQFIQAVIHTKLISFTFCVCFTFQRQLCVVYVLCEIGVRNSGLQLILGERALSFEGTPVTPQYMVLQDIRMKNSKQTSGLEV
jgi:hypothetical protein